MATKVGTLRSLAKATPDTLRKATALTIKSWGEPLSSITTTEATLPALKQNEVLIKMLAAPINPSDLNTVQGVYPLRPELPGVGGHEGVGQVLALGPQSSKFSVGDFVVPLASSQGTWRTAGNFAESAWHAVSPDLSLADAATLTVNPGTALLMLEMFEDLQPGDCVVQNGGNSAVGQYVIQLAKHKKLKTINVVRDSPKRDWSATVKWLTDMGADVVATPETVREVAKESGLPEPKLALNCVGGEIATTMAKMLAPSGTLVSYGAMGKQPVTVPIPLQIFKDVRTRGFWISGRASKELGPQGKADLYDRLAKLILDGTIKSPCDESCFHPLQSWEKAFEAAQAAGSKVLLRMTD